MSRRESKAARRKRKIRNRIIAADCILLIAAIVVCVVLSKSRSSEIDWVYINNYKTAETKETETYELSEDTTKPDVWTASHIYCSVGDVFTESDYLDYVYVYDDYDPDPDIVVDDGLVDTSEAGTYPVSYTVTDASGNVKFASIDVVVCDDTPAVVSGFKYDEEDLYNRCTAILDSIITDDMTDLQKIFAVFYYVRGCTYTSQRTTMEYKQEAYYFLTVGSDNCYGNVSLSKVLLEMLGYDCFMIEGYDMDYNQQEHYWNMVSIDGGENWYHYDAAHWTWQNSDLPICMVTETVLLEISNRHGGIHNFDSTLYPTNDGTDLWTKDTAAALGISLTS